MHYLSISAAGRLVSAASEIVFLLTLLLLGKGWTVVRLVDVNNA